MKSFAIANLEEPPSAGFFDRLAQLAEARVDRILIRDASRPDRERHETAVRARTLIEPPTSLFVHGRVDLALAAKADGVHLPASGIRASEARRIAPGLVIGRSCHSLAECAAAASEGVDYVFLGPVFDTRSKPGEGRIDRSTLEEAARLELDVFALGGISMRNLDFFSGIPLAGVAAITMFMLDQPVEAVVEAVRRA